MWWRHSHMNLVISVYFLTNSLQRSSTQFLDSFPFKDLDRTRLTAQHGDKCWVGLDKGQDSCQPLHCCEHLMCKKQTCTCYKEGRKKYFKWGTLFFIKKTFYCNPTDQTQCSWIASGFHHTNSAVKTSAMFPWQSRNTWDCKDHVGSRSFIWKLSLAQN